MSRGNVRKKRMRNIRKIAIIVTVLIYMSMFIWQAVETSTKRGGDVSLNEFYSMVDNKKIDSIVLNRADRTITVFGKDGKNYVTVNPDNDTFLKDIMERGVKVQVQQQTVWNSTMGMVTYVPIMVIVSMLAIYLGRTVIGASTKMFTLLKADDNKVTFDMIKGISRTKEQVQFIISQMRNVKGLQKLGARPVKGALLFGPPGVGKTMLAKAIAKESGVNFISCSGSDFDEVFVGVGAARVRNLFELASYNTPCIIFIDEIDCLGRRRRGGDGSTNDHNQTSNSLLQLMDGLNDTEGIMIVGATNRKEDLDSALLRPGRFDKHFYIGAPDSKKDRDELVELYLRDKQLGDGVDVESASRLLVGLTGAEIEEALNNSVFLSMKDNRNGVITLEDIDEAVMMSYSSGVKSEHISEGDIQVTSIHEAGHCIMELLEGNKVAKVSNIPYTSGLGGVTMRDMDEDRNKMRLQSEIESDIKVLLAGKCAEYIRYGEATPGCSNDIQKANQLILGMMFGGAQYDSLIDYKGLIENGYIKGIPENILKEVNSKLLEIEAEVVEDLREHWDLVKGLCEMLVEHRTIINPTIDKIEEYNSGRIAR